MSTLPILPLIFVHYSYSHLISTTSPPTPTSTPECPESKFHQEVTFTLDQLKSTLETKGFVLIPGKVMKKLLIQHGASEDDLAVLESGYIHKRLPVDQQPVMYHRKVNEMQDYLTFNIQHLLQTSCHRVLLNTTDNTIFPADTHTITQYPKNEIASEGEDGAKIAYRRCDIFYSPVLF